ncbi:MAG: T9SS type A sorting domain-containing protein [Ignavibacteriaceae bacterium]|nr:T9SS type A sorting domain-containing protein [Ignavibacteriaceae bacterium]
MMQKRILITLVLMVLALNTHIFGDIGQGYSPIKPLSTIANITILKPNGGEVFLVGVADTIKWNSTNLLNVKLEYSTNNGINWLTIVTSTTAITGSYLWTIPFAHSAECKIKVSGVDAAVYDESDNVFSIINNRPEINFAEIPNYQNEVVYPVIGSDETLFEYIIKYTSAENKAPLEGFPKIVLDFNGNGLINDPGEGEFSLTPADLNDTTYSDGKLYSYLTTLPLGINHKVKFIGADSDGDTAIVNQALLQFRSVPSVIGGLPDAVVEAGDIIFSDENPDPAEPFTMSAKVYNRSDQNLENLTVKFYKDNSVIGEKTIQYLSHRTETTVSLQTVINEAGFYAMQIRVDPDNLISEKSELNNIALRPLPVGNAPIPGSIEVTAPVTHAYAFTPFYFRGSAKYVGVFGGDQVVQGGRVKVTLLGEVYYGTTNSNGDFTLILPCIEPGIYPVSIEVTDTRLTGTTVSEVICKVLTGKDIAIISMVLSKYQPVIGETITAHIKARNAGTETLFNVPVHLFNNYEFKDSYIIPSLAPGQEMSISLTTSFTRAGLYYVIAIADPLNTIPEINKKNNGSYQTAVVIADKPDLAVTGIDVLGKLKINSNVTIYASIQNIGGGLVSEPFIIRVELDGQVIGQQTVNNLASGNSVSISVNHQFAYSGGMQVKVYADFTNTITEWDENNNTGALLIYVAPQLPNLTFTTGSLINVPLNPGVGQPVQFYVTAKNSGELASPPSQVRFSVTGVDYSSVVNVPALAVNEEAVITSASNWVPGSENTFISKAEIDFSGQVTEGDELDNGMTLAVVVGYGSDLALDSAQNIRTSKLYAHPGETVQLSALVKNHGSLLSTAHVEFYYLNNNAQRVYINTAIVTVPGSDTASSGIVNFTLPFAPVNIFARLVNSQPPDYNLTNNEQTLLIGDRAPVITGLDTLVIAEDSSLTVNLNEYVFDGGDPQSSLTWEFTPNANIATSYQQGNQTVLLTPAPDYYGTELLTVKVRDPRFNYTTKNVSVVVTQVIDYPGTPVLVSPVSGTAGLVQPVTVIWRRSTYTDKYYLQAATDSLFSSIAISDSSLTDTVKSISSLAHYTKYYWRVKGINSEAHGEWSSVWSFKTLGGAYAVELVSPADNVIHQPVSGLRFTWKKPQERIETILRYQFQLSADSLFSAYTVNDTTLTDTTRLVSALVYNTEYFWRVRAGNEAGWGEWSAVRRLRTIIEKPPVTLLSFPLNNAIMQVQPVTVVWQKAPRAERYILEVSQNAGFSSFVLRDTSLTDTFKVLPQLASPLTYYWRVRSANIGGMSDNSAVWNFRTLGLPLTVTLLSPANNSIHQPVNNLLLQWRKAGEQTLIAGAIRKNTITEEDGNIYRESPVTPLRSGSKNSFANTLSDNPNGISQYWLQMTNDTSGGIYIISDSTLADTFKVLPELNYLTSYFWRVKAKNETGWGDVSGWFRFTTVIERPAQPLLATPADGSTGLSQPVALVWNRAFRADIYTLQVSQSPQFTSLAYSDSMITDTAISLPALSVFTRYYWRVLARNAGGVSDTSAVWSFRTRGIPYAVSLVYPAQNAVNIPAEVTFLWNRPVSSEMTYRYWLERTRDTSGQLIYRDTTLADTSFTALLSAATVNYWRVKAGNEAGWGQFTSWHKFTTLPPVPAIPGLSSPVNNALAVPLKPRLRWTRTLHAESYHLQFASDPNFTNLLINDSTITDTSRMTDSLQFKTAYYWRLASKNISGVSTFSQPRKFTTVFRPVEKPTNLTATAIAHKKVKLTWQDNALYETRYVVLRKQGDSTSGNQLVTLATIGANSVEYTDSTVADSLRYSYKVYAFNSDTTSPHSNYAVVLTLTDVTEFANGSLPEEYTIQQNYPNPFNPSTTIRYGLPYDSDVRLEIYDISGQKLQTLVDQTQSAGYYEAVFDISGMSSGTYLYVLTATRLDGDGEFHQVKKMILLK